MAGVPTEAAFDGIEAQFIVYDIGGDEKPAADWPKDALGAQA